MFERTKKGRMVGAFAVSLRRGKHSHHRHKGPLVAGTVSKAISNLAATFQEHNQADPRKTNENETDKFITNIIKSFRKSDPKEKAQKAITPALLWHLYTRGKTDFFTHLADLTNGAFFFACRSYEYSKTSGTRKTKTITLGNIAFRRGHKQLTEHHAADSVSVTFVAQKNDKYHDTVTHHSTSDEHFCPVKIWSAIFNRVANLKDAGSHTTINSFYNPHHKRKELITSTQVLNNL